MDRWGLQDIAQPHAMHISVIPSPSRCLKALKARSPQSRHRRPSCSSLSEVLVLVSLLGLRCLLRLRCRGGAREGRGA